MTRPRLYLHIGHPKTGTTSIQNYLLQQADRLLAQGYLYPRAGRRNAAQAVHFRLFPITYYHQDEENRAPQVLAALRAEVARHAPKAVIVSCEISFAEDTAYLKEAFSDFDVRVLYYIRRQDLWIASFYAERAKYARMPEFRPLRGMESDWIPDYLGALRRFAAAFGRERVRVRPFEKNAWVNGDLVQDFLAQVDLDPAAFPPSRGVLNESLKSRHLQFLLACNQLPLLRMEAAALRKAVLALSAADPNRREAPVLLDVAARRRILDRCAADNAAIAREFLGRSDGVLFRDPVAETGAAPDGSAAGLTPADQQALFDGLPPPVRASLEAVSSRIRHRTAGRPFLPAPCPDDPGLQQRLWCLREVRKLERQILATRGRARPFPDCDGDADLLALSEPVFFDRMQETLTRLRTAVLARAAVQRPDLVPDPPAAGPRLSPDGAAFARACWLLPLWSGERRALWRALEALAEADPAVPREALDPAEGDRLVPPLAAPVPADRQQRLFDRLDPAVRRFLVFLSPAIRERLPGRLFWPAIPDDPVLWRQQILAREVKTLHRLMQALGGETVWDPAAAAATARRPRLPVRVWRRLKRIWARTRMS